MSKSAEDYICKCHKITKQEFKDKIKEGFTTYKELKNETKIGSSCSSCKKKAKKRLEKYLSKLNT